MAARNRKSKAYWETDDVKRDQPRTCPVSGKRMYANEREAKATAAEERRRDNLARFQKLTDASPLWEWAAFIGKDSPLDKEAWLQVAAEWIKLAQNADPSRK